MNGKHYIGRRASSFDLYDELGPVTGVEFFVDDENVYFAGSRDGYVIVAECPYATEQMAADALAKVIGKTYKGFRATGVSMPVDVERGDAVTVNGVYSIMADQVLRFGPNHMSEISAPGENTIDHEYPYVSTERRDVERKIAQNRSLFTKKAEEISLRVESAENKVADVELTVGGFRTSIENLETNMESSLVVDEKGAVFTSGGKPVTISGGSIDASTINANQVAAATLYGSEILLRDGPTVADVPGHIMLTSASTAQYAVELHSDGALRLMADTGAAWFEAGGGMSRLALSGSEANAIFHEKITPVNSGVYTLGDANYRWSTVYISSNAIVTSDLNLKNSIELLPVKYVDMVLWLSPKRFKLNDGTSDRYHVGFIAQDVKEGMDLFGIDPMEFGGWVKDKDENGDDIYMLRYEEFIAIILAAVQTQKKVIDDHEERLRKLEAMMNG